MHRIPATRAARLDGFFDPPPPNAPMLQSFFDGRISGRAFVDDRRRPTACAIAVNYRFAFFGGRATPEFVARALDELRRDFPVRLVWCGRPASGPPRPAPKRVVERVELCLPSREARSAGSPPLAIPGAEIRRIDRKLLRRCQWRDEVANVAGSPTEFLRHGIGFCVLAGERIVAEAYGFFWGKDRMEIAAITSPGYRRRGLARLVCGHLVQLGAELGFSAYWGAERDNAPSLALAARLGFRGPRPYRVLHYDQRCRDA